MIRTRALFVGILTLSFLTLSATAADASLLYVDNKGGIVWNVLASTDSIALGTPQKSEIEVKELAGGKEGESTILLKKEDGKIVLNVGDTKQLDVTNWDDELVEIEERGSVKKIKVLIKDGKFFIEQADLQAETEFPININPKENELSLVTGSGAIFLSILPLEAAETSLKSRFMSKVTDKKLQISEKELGVLAYSVKGEKALNFLNVVDLNVPVTTFVSTTTGEIISVDQPKWLSIVGFLFR